MGCTSSKQARLDSGRIPQLQRSSTTAEAAFSDPFRRSRSKRRASADYSQRRATTLTSSSSARLAPDSPSAVHTDGEEIRMKTLIDRSMSLPVVAEAESVPVAKPRSEAVEKRITPLREEVITPPQQQAPEEPETIDAWEILEGLHDLSPIRQPGRTLRSLSCHVALPPPVETDDETEDEERQQQLTTPAQERQNSASKHANAKWDPPSRNQLQLHRLSLDAPRTRQKQTNANGPSVVQDRIKAFQEEINARKAARAAQAATPTTAQVSTPPSTTHYKNICPPSGEDKVVLYLTSLRGVRKTYEDCSDALLVLKGYGVRVDERDVSMHAGFKDELTALLGPDQGGGLPRVFANGRYIGGSEVVRQLHEDGKLKGLLQGCAPAAPTVASENIGAVLVLPCGGCGDARFVPCEACSGSCKLFVGDNGNADGGDEEGGAFRRCPECNENGLIRCPVCCAS